MENLIIIIKVLVGVALGAIMSLLPNASPPLVTISVSSLLGAEACVGALVSSLFFSTFIECSVPETSGDEMLTMSLQEDSRILYSFGHGILTQHVLKIKTYALFIGLTIGTVVGLVDFPFLAPSGVSWSAIIIGASVVFVKLYQNDNGELAKNLKPSIMFLLTSISWTTISLLLSIPFPVLSLGLCLFIIPSSFSKSKGRDQKDPGPGRVEAWVGDDSKLRYTSLIASIFGAGAGINFNTTNISLNRGVSRLMNYFFIYVFIEFVALGRIGTGNGASGISQVGSEVNNIHFIPILLSCSVTLTLIAYLWKNLKLIELFYLNRINFLKRLGGVMSVFAVIILAGIYAPFLIGIGLLLHKHLTSVLPELKGAMYLIPVLT